ncbi:MAG TPA: zf-TFIIB domain-containing protein [Thermoplasmata archaeon]|nr:zf-TFIIB domain-containing protein [Thermoplasmata archaeon]
MAKKIRADRECPRDWTPLKKEPRKTHLRTIEVDECPSCHGLFLDKKEIRRLTGDAALNKLLTKYLGLDSDSPLVCPNCGGLMDIEDAGAVRVDVCLDCNGVWLDAGELERLASMDDAEFRHFTPEKIEEILKAREIRREERVKAVRTLFRGLRRG